MQVIYSGHYRLGTISKNFEASESIFSPNYDTIDY